MGASRPVGIRFPEAFLYCGSGRYRLGADEGDLRPAYRMLYSCRLRADRVAARAAVTPSPAAGKAALVEG